jgi:hypothetical protein
VAKILLDLAVCGDCLIAIANDDYSGMDDETEARVRAGIEHLSTKGYITLGGDELGFQHSRCECCGALPGDRYTAHVMSD